MSHRGIRRRLRRDREPAPPTPLQQRVLDALSAEPRTVPEIARVAGLDTQTTRKVLLPLRQKNLAVGQHLDPPLWWRV